VKSKLLRRIVADASTLWERLEGFYVPEPDTNSAKLTEIRFEKWRERAARGNSHLFEKRLHWLDTTAEEAISLIGKARLEGDLPQWAQVFIETMDAPQSVIEDSKPSSHPFGTILFPFAKTGFGMLAPACHSIFTQEILDKLTDDLLRELSYIAAPTFYLEFSVFRSEQAHSEDEARDSAELYKRFETGLLEGRLWDFFSEYPVLARLLSITVQLWAQNVSEMADALEADLPAIQKLFNDNGEIGRVVAVRPSLSDRHNEGRTITILEFENGLELVHKPRSLGIEKAWFSLLEHLNKRGGDFRLLKVLDRPGHGWVEVARHAPCDNSDEARKFYSRAGMLLCLLYALEASDCFYENIIACGSYPVLIDMETLMRPALTDISSADAAADDILFASVFRAGFLPFWEAGQGGICVDISGLGAKSGQLTPYQKRLWENINTDAMRLKHEPILVDSEKHLPRLNGASLTAAEYAEEIVSGFRQIYELLMELREELTAHDGLIDALGQQEIRILFHATRISGLFLKRLYAPRHMRSGVERSIETDVFSRFYLESSDKSRLWPLLKAEIDAMERLDIPRFTVFANSRSLCLPTGKTLENVFKDTALDRVRHRLSSLDRADMEMQAGFIRDSLRVSSISVRHESASCETVEAWNLKETAKLSSDELVAEAAAIAAEIESRAIFFHDEVTWIAPQLLPRSSRYELRPLRMDLYNGVAGVALFFAALNRVMGTGRTTALAAISSLWRFVSVADAARMVREGYGLGIATGAGSFIYAFTRCATLLEEPALFAYAMAASERITPEWIAADNHFDAMSGAAGAILGLLALEEETANSAIVEKAVLCGDHLLCKQESAGQGAAWRAINGKFMTGFSHGAAGIALALLRLGKASGEERFRMAARQAIAFEDSVFDVAEGNWPDFRYSSESQSVFMNSWCHGAPGIGLGRHSGLSLFDSPEVRADINAALRKVSESSIGEKDGLCCGNLGRIDMLLAVAVRRADEQLHHNAIQMASVVIERARRSGGYRLSGQPGQDFFDPSFFQGLSGIGFELLRIAHPQTLPCVLAWE
jgi:type 2 lantibiotic biosynthesis protein LanM